MKWRHSLSRGKHRWSERPRRTRPKVHLNFDRLERRWLLALSSGIVEYATTAANSLPQSLVAGADGNVWVAEAGSKELAAFTPTGGLVRAVALAQSPYDITSAPNGSLWFTETGPTSYVGTVSTSGTGLAQYALPTAATPQGITPGTDGNIWFVEYGTSLVGKITPQGSITTYALSANSRPESIVAGSDGNLWVTEAARNRIARVTIGGSITEFSVPTAQSSPWGIAAGPDGNLWFTELSGNKIGRITTSGIITEFSLGSCCTRPTGIASGPDGNLWFTGPYNNTLDRITTGGIITSYALPTASAADQGVQVGPDGSIWWTEYHAGQIGKLPWIPDNEPLSPDPVLTQYQDFSSASIGPQNGDLRVQIPLDPASVCYTCGNDSSALLQSSLYLTYNSDTVDVMPIIASSFASDPNGPVPTQIQVQLTWNNGPPQPWVTFSTAGHNAGDVYLLSTQVATPVTATGVYPWKVEIQATLPSGSIIDSTLSGTVAVVANGSGDPIGQGWSIGGIAQLISDGNGGFVWVDGDGGTRVFQAGNGTTFVSPPQDFGTLVKNPSGTFTYTNPQQVEWMFNSQGLLTSINQPDGPAMSFTYDSSGKPTSITQPGGWTVTFTYDSQNRLDAVSEPGNRGLSTTHDSNDNLTGATMPDGSSVSFTYDSESHLTNVEWGSQNTTYSYDSEGAISGANMGLGSTLGLEPASLQGLQTNPAVSVSQEVSVITDALGHLTTYTYNGVGEPTKLQTPDGAVSTWQYDFAGQPVLHTDPLGRTTRYTYQYGSGAGELTQTTFPDGSSTEYQYDPTFHQVTLLQDALGRATTYAYSAQGNRTTIINPLGGVTSETWSDGLLQSVTDPLQHTTRYQYDGQRQLIDEVDPLGNRTTYGYDAADNQVTVEDALGRVTTYVYDGMRRVVEQIDPLGGITTTTYDAQGDVTSVIDPLGHVTLNTYDQRGLETSRTEAAGTPVASTTLYDYDALGRLISETDPNGHTTSYAYDSVGNLLATTNALQAVTSNSYDLDNELISTTDPLGHVTTYSYDLRGRRTGESDAVGTPVERTTTTVYDPVGNIVETIDPLEHLTTYSYDPLNRGTGETDAIGTPVERVTTTVYDPVGNVVEKIDALGRMTTYSYDALNRRTGETDAAGTPVQRTTTSVYDAVGNVTETIDALGAPTEYTYDGLNRRTSVTDPLGFTTTTVYDADGNLTATINPRGFTTSYVYDALNRPVETIDALGEITTTIYDPAGNAIETIDARGNPTEYTYDALNRPVTVTDPLGRTTTTIYDPDGNVVASIDLLGNATTYTYDALNRQTSVHKPEGGITSTVYDADSNVIETIDPLNNTTTYLYDALNRKFESIDPRGYATTYLFDPVGNEVGLIDPDNNRTTFVYDSLNREIQTINPLGNTTTSVYDADNRLTSTTDALGRLIDYGYDADGRLITETWFDAHGNQVNAQSFTYDNNGNLLTAQDLNGLYTMTYDALDRVVTTQEPFGLSLTDAYDADGNRTLLQDSLGGVTTYVYDADNELTSEQFGGSGQVPLRFDITYDADGRLTQETRYNNLAGTGVVGQSFYTYNRDSLITNLVDRDGRGTIIANFTYTYDLADRVLTEDNLGLQTTYTYDPDGQLKSDSTASYNYDPNGNRSGAGIAIGADNQLLSDPNWNYSYDADGNLAEKTGTSTGADKGITWKYSYNNRNQITQAVQTEGSTTVTVTYDYDVLGNRVEEDVQGGSTPVTRFAYDRGNVWADLDGSNNLMTRRLFQDAVDSVVARISASGTVAWYLTDRLGSIRVLTSSKGAVTDRINYDGFGNVISQSNPSAGDRYQFTGREFDIVTGLQYNRARYYDRSTGRWTTQDPAGFSAGDANLYRYVDNDPTNASDPSGKGLLWNNGFDGTAVWNGIGEDYRAAWIELAKGPRSGNLDWYFVTDSDGIGTPRKVCKRINGLDNIDVDVTDKYFLPLFASGADVQWYNGGYAAAFYTDTRALVWIDARLTSTAVSYLKIVIDALKVGTDKASLFSNNTARTLVEAWSERYSINPVPGPIMRAIFQMYRLKGAQAVVAVKALKDLYSAQAGIAKAVSSASLLKLLKEVVSDGKDLALSISEIKMLEKEIDAAEARIEKQ
jgi:RHS repeat-associated protein